MEAKGKPGRNSLRRWRWYIAGGVAVVAIAAMFAGTGVLSALTTHPINAAVPGMVAGPKITCPGDKTLTLDLTGPKAAGYHPITTALALSWKVVNDEDSGWAGYWAMDSYVTILQVWLVKLSPGVGGYYVLETYKGNFQVPQGALSPGVTGTTPNAVPEPASGYGTMVGGYAGLINPTPGISFSWPGLPNFAYLGTLNYGGTTSDLLLTTGQTGDVTPYTWLTTYFGPTATISYGNGGTEWGWYYTLNSYFQSPTSVNQWCNFGAGNYGDIVPAA
jgi:hypothetical protein